MIAMITGKGCVGAGIVLFVGLALEPAVTRSRSSTLIRVTVEEAEAVILFMAGFLSGFVAMAVSKRETGPPAVPHSTAAQAHQVFNPADPS